MESMAKHDFTGLIMDALAEADLKPERIGITADDEGRPVLVLDGLTFDENDRIVTAEREYEVEVEMTLTLTVSVTASSEDAAQEKVELAMQFAYANVEGADDVDVEDVSIDGIEVGSAEQR